MNFHILKQGCRQSLHSLLIVNCVILVPNAILYVFNTRAQDWTLPGQHSLSARDRCNSDDCWPSRVFAPIGAADSELIDRTLRAFVAAVETANLTYFIYGGTLIGSLRHHGPIPWDDDVDVMVSADEKVQLIDVLADLSPDFGLFIPRPEGKFPQWKFYPFDGHSIKTAKHRTPYIDIFFYRENRTHIWCESPAWTMTDVWLKQNVFPLHRRPFGSLSLPAPCNALVVIGPGVEISMCKSRFFSHIKDKEELEPDIVIPCQNLTRFYPFVGKSIAVEGPFRNLVKETLMFQNWTLQEVTVHQFC